VDHVERWVAVASDWRGRIVTTIGQVSVIGERALNRALLARQGLLERHRLPPLELIDRLVGLQAQATTPPYYGLWSRLAAFDRDEVGRLLGDGELVRIKLMRGTVHMVSAADAAWLRPLVAPAIERGHNGAFGRRMGGADTDLLGRAVGELLAERPLTGRELAGELIRRGIGDDVEAIANAALTYAPLVQLPPRGVWGSGGQARYATLTAWSGCELDANPSADELVLRYLRGFGPASVRDAQSWSGLTRRADSFARLRPRLIGLRDERGRELFDLPDAPRPDPEHPAPVRFLGEFDNVTLGHADRRRIVPESFPRDALLRVGRAVNQVLVDGLLRATWWIERDGRTRAKLVVRVHGELTAAERDEVADEARRMLEFAVESDQRSVEFVR
jgi:winged helix DNA-binding protein